jgi:iron-sulfur cluster repair protein YtfE (RIC family)
LKLLLDDHALLSSSVIHVVALVRRFAVGRFEAAGLQMEIARQVELLREQLVQHFEFEETTAFPHLEEVFPAYQEQFQQFVAHHDGILRVFEIVRTELSFEGAPADGRSVQRKALAFERVFEEHATAETKLFNELASQLPEAESSRLG